MKLIKRQTIYIPTCFCRENPTFMQHVPLINPFTVGHSKKSFHCRWPAGLRTGFGLSREVLHDAGLRANGRKDDSMWLGRKVKEFGWDLVTGARLGVNRVRKWAMHGHFCLYPKLFHVIPMYLSFNIVEHQSTAINIIKHHDQRGWLGNPRTKLRL